MLRITCSSLLLLCRSDPASRFRRRKAVPLARRLAREPGAAGGGDAADVASSWGKNEANPLVRTGQRFSYGSLAIKMGALAGGLVAQHYIVRKSPEENPCSHPRIWPPPPCSVWLRAQHETCQMAEMIEDRKHGKDLAATYCIGSSWMPFCTGLGFSRCSLGAAGAGAAAPAGKGDSFGGRASGSNNQTVRSG